MGTFNIYKNKSLLWGGQIHERGIELGKGGVKNR